MWPLLASIALASPPLGEWVADLGEPSVSPAEAEARRTDGEPLLVYWLQTSTRPLGVGPAVPGTVVANFAGTGPLETRPVLCLTLLGVASPDQTAALVGALREHRCIQGERDVNRDGGAFVELTLACPDGRLGTLALREGPQPGPLPDGRPSPSFWLYVVWPSP